MMRLVPVLSLCVLAGCTQPESPPEQPAPAPAAPVQLSYLCESGRNVAVEYPDRRTARLVYEDRIYVLQSLPAASGARYAGAEFEWATATRNGEESGVLTRVADNAERAGAVVERCARPASDITPPKPTPAPLAAGASAAQAPPCKAGQLALATAGGDAGMGHRTTIIGLTNTDAQACSLTGYAAVQLLDRQNRVLTGIRSTSAPGAYLRAGETPRPVELAPGGRAFFDLAWTVIPHEDQGETTCPSVTRVQVTAPGDVAGLPLALTFSPCGGKVDVTPFRSEAEPAPDAEA